MNPQNRPELQEGAMKIGDGKTAEVFEYGEKNVCKLFRPGYPVEYVEYEFGNAQILFKLGIHVPKPYEMICKDGRKESFMRG